MPFLHLHRRSAFREPSSSSSTSSSSSSSSSSGSGLPSFSLAYDASGSADACLFSAPSTYYAAALTVGEIIYNDPDGLFEAADGYYSDGVDWWQKYAVLISATGSCSSPSSSSSSSSGSSSSSSSSDPAPTAVGSIPDQTSEEGETISLYINSYFADDDALSYSASGLPSGLSINSSTGEITGTLPNESAGSNAVTVTATDGDDDVDQLFDWTVTDPSPVAVGTIPDQSTEEGVGGIFWDITGYFSDPDGDTLSYSSSTLPPGLSVSSGGTVSGTISGGASSGSPYAVTITASDGDHSVDQTFDWVVAAP